MESPHEEIQAVLLERIIKNADKLLEAIRELNHCVEEIKYANMDVDIAAELFLNYRRNVQYNLGARGVQQNPVMIKPESPEQ
ncbi:hypothetical protein BOTBODRAFT_99074 [Botryobasidium botryosum FD-172 SS1]|uniref:DASH complex subunit DAD4 n=1 Tax=Botryobasidium botryosum (strain FD-172 SS1) TaxID=930990 RepID=A0A067N0U5_BOTB1|nr:hypothetical protein BOTBODRAFT_99074 [Botryobasidium botryosum FD-172 SS1]